MRITWHGSKPRKTQRSELAAHVGRRLAALRERDQVTMREVSEQTRLSNAFVCQIENGQSSPTIETLWKLAQYFGVGVEWFVEGYKEPRDKTKQRKR